MDLFFFGAYIYFEMLQTFYFYLRTYKLQYAHKSFVLEKPNFSICTIQVSRCIFLMLTFRLANPHKLFNGAILTMFGYNC
jgi:hypothetical protein